MSNIKCSYCNAIVQKELAIIITRREFYGEEDVIPEHKMVFCDEKCRNDMKEVGWPLAVAESLQRLIAPSSDDPDWIR